MSFLVRFFCRFISLPVLFTFVSLVISFVCSRGLNAHKHTHMHTHVHCTPSVCHSFVCGENGLVFIEFQPNTLESNGFLWKRRYTRNQYVLHAICCALLAANAARSMPAMRCSRFSRRCTSNYQMLHTIMMQRERKQRERKKWKT